MSRNPPPVLRALAISQRRAPDGMACSQNLGVQRTSISMVAHTLQLAGIIRTRRGKIEILDRTRLQSSACECYQQVKQRIDTPYSEAA
jgi:hypothetical protein